MKKSMSIAQQLTNISDELFGNHIDYVEQSKVRNTQKNLRKINGIKLNLKAKTNADMPGYSYRTACYVTDAVLPNDYVLQKERLDAPCEMCINMQCPNSWGEIPRK